MRCFASHNWTGINREENCQKGWLFFLDEINSQKKKKITMKGFPHLQLTYSCITAKRPKWEEPSVLET